MFAGFRRFVGASSAQALVGAVCVSTAASVYSFSTPRSELGVFGHRSNQSRNQNSHITLNAAERLSLSFPFDFENLSLDKIISVSHCHEAGDSCCKEPTKHDSLGPVSATGKGTGESVISRVVELSTLSFEELVLKNDKDVFVVFYAPWCGYCKRLFPVWEELAQQQHSPTSSMVVSQIDMTQHDLPHVPGVVVRGYPTIYLFKKGHKGTPIEYRGGRDVVSFSAFLTYYTNI